MIGTLPAHVDQTGLGLPEPDLLVILMRSLPEAVRQYALHHASGESYGAYRQAARRWEEQQRLFSEALSSFSQDTHGKRIAQLDGSVEWYSMDATDSAWTWEHMDAVQNYTSVLSVVQRNTKGKTAVWMSANSSVFVVESMVM